MLKDNFYFNCKSKIEIEFNGEKILKENVVVFYFYDEEFSFEDSVIIFMVKLDFK